MLPYGIKPKRFAKLHSADKCSICRSDKVVHKYGRQEMQRRDLLSEAMEVQQLFSCGPDWCPACDDMAEANIWSDYEAPDAHFRQWVGRGWAMT